jgi:hypothetical protein
MRFLYEAHIPFVAVFLLFAVALAFCNWKGRRPQ